MQVEKATSLEVNLPDWADYKNRSAHQVATLLSTARELFVLVKPKTNDDDNSFQLIVREESGSTREEIIIASLSTDDEDYEWKAQKLLLGVAKAVQKLEKLYIYRATAREYLSLERLLFPFSVADWWHKTLTRLEMGSHVIYSNSFDLLTYPANLRTLSILYCEIQDEEDTVNAFIKRLSLLEKLRIDGETSWGVLGFSSTFSAPAVLSGIHSTNQHLQTIELEDGWTFEGCSKKEILSFANTIVQLKHLETLRMFLEEMPALATNRILEALPQTVIRSLDCKNTCLSRKGRALLSKYITSKKYRPGFKFSFHYGNMREVDIVEFAGDLTSNLSKRVKLTGFDDYDVEELVETLMPVLQLQPLFSNGSLPHGLWPLAVKKTDFLPRFPPDAMFLALRERPYLLAFAGRASTKATNRKRKPTSQPA